MGKYDGLKLENQICFLFYVASKELIRCISPKLGEMGLTYTGYLVMMVLWEHKQLKVKEVGAHLYLDSGTLTPLLKKLEIRGLIKRKRSKEDERSVFISLTQAGIELREQALAVPEILRESLCMNLPEMNEATKMMHQLVKDNFSGRT